MDICFPIPFFLDCPFFTKLRHNENVLIFFYIYVYGQKCLNFEVLARFVRFSFFVQLFNFFLLPYEICAGSFVPFSPFYGFLPAFTTSYHLFSMYLGHVNRDEYRILTMFVFSLKNAPHGEKRENET